ncbi:MAG: arsenate reductase (thioredoxin) [Clostridia bacterium]|nr:arsenate reductase (thioredoxin) [Clostridia bacterium]
MLTDPFQGLAESFRALGDPTRLRILSLLRDGELCVCELTAALEAPQPAVSQHLRRLRQAGLVSERRAGQWVFYALAAASAPAVQAALEALPEPSVEKARLADRAAEMACRRQGAVPETARRRLLFLCTGNACRSQMAEGFARVLGGHFWEVESAGTDPKGLDPRAVRVMAEVGVDISAQQSKALRPDQLQRADLVITLCGDAEERCPVTPPGVERRHWPLEDPARARGGEEQVLARFRAVRDAIRRHVEALLAEEATRARRGHGR